MHKHLTTALVGFGVLFLSGTARADGTTEAEVIAAEAKAIVVKAIAVHGGADKLAKAKAATWTTKGTYYGLGDGIPFTATYAVQWPERFRFEVEGAFIFVLDGDKGWQKAGDDVKEMSKEELAYHKEGAYDGWVRGLAPLTGKEFTLTKLDEIKVDGKPAVGVKVASKGHADISLYFDKDSFLLVKSERRVKAPEQMNKEVNQESFMTDYKDVDGVKVAMKFVDKRDGKVYVEGEISDMKHVEKLEAKLFAKP